MLIRRLLIQNPSIQAIQHYQLKKVLNLLKKACYILLNELLYIHTKRYTV